MTWHEYVEAHRTEWIGLGAVFLIFGGIFLLYQLPAEAYFNSAGLVLLLMALWHGLRFTVARRRENWKERAEQAERRLRDVEAESQTRQEDLESYFLTWVHQLKTPVTAARLIAEQEVPWSEADGAALREQLLSIEAYSDMAMSYVKVIDPVADLDLGIVDPNPVLKVLLRKYSILFIRKRLSVDFQPAKRGILTDARWFGLLFEQLLSNSLKYTEKGGIRIAFPESDTLELSDSGIGIPEQDLPRIFDRGYSGWNGRKTERSSGLGLFLAKRIAERLHIRLELRSHLGEGTVARLTFPSRWEVEDHRTLDPVQSLEESSDLTEL